eukprot:9485261-Pyramimonas_sp.AAC.2
MHRRCGSMRDQSFNFSAPTSLTHRRRRRCIVDMSSMHRTIDAASALRRDPQITDPINAGPPKRHRKVDVAVAAAVGVACAARPRAAVAVNGCQRTIH